MSFRGVFPCFIGKLFGLRKKIGRKMSCACTASALFFVTLRMKAQAREAAAFCVLHRLAKKGFRKGKYHMKKTENEDLVKLLRQSRYSRLRKEVVGFDEEAQKLREAIAKGWRVSGVVQVKTEPDFYAKYCQVLNEYSEQAQDMAERLSDLLNKSVPLSEIENELMKFPSGVALSIYFQLNALLAGNALWLANTSRIRDNILAKQQKEMMLNMNVTAQPGSHVNALVQQQTNNGTIPEIQLVS